LELSQQEREVLLAEIWLITKKLLPFTMGETSFGLVGARKIFFSALPEIVLPIDNIEWLHVFQTVDLGDVLLKEENRDLACRDLAGMRDNQYQEKY